MEVESIGPRLIIISLVLQTRPLCMCIEPKSCLVQLVHRTQALVTCISCKHRTRAQYIEEDHRGDNVAVQGLYKASILGENLAEGTIEES